MIRNNSIEPLNVDKSRSFLEPLYFIGFMLILAFVLYNTPKIISVFVQLVLLYKFYKSPNNYYYFAIMMFVAFSPGGLFHIKAPVLLSIINLPGIGVITFNQGCMIVAIIKTRKHIRRAFYTTPWTVIAIYVLFLLLVYGGRFQTAIRGLASFSLLLTTPLLMNNENSYYRLFNIIFFCNIFSFLANIFEISVGYPLIRLFAAELFADEVSRHFLFLQYDTEGLVRTVYGIPFAFLSIVGVLLYLTYKKSPFNTRWLYTILFIALLNIVFSATRGWMIASAVLVFGYSYIIIPRLFRDIAVVIPLLLILYLVAMGVPLIREQASKAFIRLRTSEFITEADVTVAGRYVAGQRVLEKYYESPIIGFGFGETGSEFYNGHTGNQSMLLRYGGLGYLIILIFWLYFINGLINKNKLLPSNSQYKNALYLPVASLIGIFIIHTTSGVRLDPLTGGMFVAIIFSLGNYLYTQAEKYSKKVEIRDWVISPVVSQVKI